MFAHIKNFVDFSVFKECLWKQEQSPFYWYLLILYIIAKCGLAITSKYGILNITWLNRNIEFGIQIINYSLTIWIVLNFRGLP